MNIFKNIIFAALVVSASVSCDNLGDVNENVDPVFPEEYTDLDVLPGQIVEFTFTPNVDWTVSIPHDMSEHFWLLDGNFKYRTLQGRGGSEVTMRIGVTDIEHETDSRRCKVLISMGGQSAVLADLCLAAKNKTVTVSSAVYADGVFEVGEDGYIYGEPSSSVELVWTGADFRVPLKVNSNFSWTVSFPEWLKGDIPAVKYGETTFNIYGEPTRLPLETTVGKIIFKHNNEVVQEINVTIPGCRSIFSYNVAMQLTEFDFTASGYLKTTAGYIDSPANVTVFGPRDFKIAVVGNLYGKYVQSAPSWIVLKVDDYLADGDVLQNRNVEITVHPNTGKSDKEAYIFFLPSDVATDPDLEDLFENDNVTIKPEYADYALKVFQHVKSDKYITPDSDYQDRALKAVTFNESTDEALTVWSNDAYEVIYAKTWSQDEGYIHLATKYDNINVYDHNKTLISSENLSSFWCSFDAMESRMYGRIIVSEEKIPQEDAVAYFEFIGIDKSVLAVIKFRFDPTCIPDLGDFSTEVKISNDYIAEAEKEGITLTEVTEGDIYEAYKEYNCPIYHLSFTKDASKVKLTLPVTATCYVPNPYQYRSNILVNDMDFDNRIGEMTKTNGAVFVKAIMPETIISQVDSNNIQHKENDEQLEDYVFDGMLAFYNARNANTASNDNISFVLYYNLTLPYTE